MKQLMGPLLVIAVIAAVSAGIYWAVRRLQRSFAGGVYRAVVHLAGSAATAVQPEEVGPRSVSNCTALYLPQIQKDFPGFDVDAALAAAATHLTGRFLSGKDGVQVHQCAISAYRRERLKKTITFQLSAQYRTVGPQGPSIRQVKYSCDYTDHTGPVSSQGNCPQCGAPMESETAAKCAFCGYLFGGGAGRWAFSGEREL